MATARPESVQDGLAALHTASFGWALACCGGDRQEAEDVLQAAYVKVLDGRARFEGGSTFKTWLFAVIRRTAGERRRGRWTRTLALDRWWRARGGPPAVPDPEELATGAETGRRLRAALRVLPRRQRELLHLVFYQDLTLQEAADVAGISIGSARRHYHRGKVRLRALMGDS
jgi:RNA polymerase sigma-70 factor (ECF subfamily)